MLLQKNVILVGTDPEDGYLYAFDPQTGEVRWKWWAAPGIGTDLVAGPDLVYAVTLDDVLVCLDLETGAEQWRSVPETTVSSMLTRGSTPALEDETIVFAGVAGRVQALDARTGAAGWSTEVGGPVTTSVALHRSRALVGTEAGVLHALDRTTGTVLRSVSLPGSPRGEIVTTEAGLVVLVGEDGWRARLVALDDDLTVAWESVATDGSLWTSARPTRAGRWILVGTASGELAAISSDTGETDWTLPIEPMRDWTGDGIRSASIVAGRLIVGTIAGRLTSYRLPPEILAGAGPVRRPRPRPVAMAPT